MNSVQNQHRMKQSASGTFRFAWLSIPIFLALVGFLWLADIKIVLEPPYLFPLLNFIFATAVSVFVAYLASISFARNASMTALMLGSGMLFFGTTSFMAAIAIQLGYINAGVTVYNTGMLFAGICHLLAAIALISENRVHRNAILAISATYALVLTVTGLLAYVAATDLTPVFFIQGIGPTPLRQAVLGTAISLHVLSGIIIDIYARRFHWPFGRWYALSLWMIAIGLFGFLIISYVGSPLAWSARAALYVGGLYMLVAVLTAAREGGEWDAVLQSALKESQERYRILTEATFEGIAISEEGVIVDVNEQFCRMLGYAQSGLIGKRVVDLIPENERERVLGTILSGQNRTDEHSMLKKDGTIIVVESHGRTILRNGRQIRFSAVRDITDRKRSEMALRESEDKFSKAFYNSPVLLFITERDTGLFIEVNNAYAVLTGFKHEELIGHTSIELGILTSESRDEIIRHLSQSGRVQNMQAQIVTKSGEIKTCLFSAEQLKYRGKPCLICSGIDITERKQAEEALERMRLLMSEGQKLAHLGSFEYIAATGETVWSDEEFRIYGLEPGPCSPSFPELMQKHFHPEDTARVDQQFSEALQRGSRYEMEHRIVRPDGSVRDLYNVAQPDFDAQGKLVKYIGATLDITDRKRIEEVLEAERSRLLAVLESLPVAVWIADQDGTVIQTNRAVENIWGKQNAPYGKLKGWWADTGKALEPEDWALARAVFKGDFSAGETIDIERFNGERATILNNAAPIKDKTGRIIGGVAVAQDITTQKQAERSLRESEARLRLALDAAHMVAWEYDPATLKVTLSENAEKVLELPGRHENSNQGYNLIHPSDAEQHRNLVTQAIATGGSYVSEYRHTRGEKEIWLEEYGRAVIDRTGKTIRLVGVVQNITDRKKAADTLRESEEKFRTVFEQAAVGIGRVSFDDACWIEVNDMFCRMLGYSRKELLSTPWPQITHPDDVDSDLIPFRRMAAGELDSYTVEKRFIHKQGHHVWARLTLSLVRDAKGMPNYEIAVIEDINDKKTAEKTLKASLAEKEVLLKEIHHRVKNNMQVISSLVALQADQIKDAALSNILKEVTDRVRSMAMVHEKLYQSPDLAGVDFADYMQSLVNYLWRSYGNTAPGVRLELDLSPVFLPVNFAVPCGLILNELFSNAIKHAFRGRSSGKVKVALDGNPNGQVQLSVADNGIGLPSGMNWRQSPSLGLTLVQTLATQLHATVEVVNAEGTEFKIFFEIQT
jgi:PAS domain S-box-containing protein